MTRGRRRLGGVSTKTSKKKKKASYLYYSSLAKEWRVGRFLDSKLYSMSVASVNELPQGIDADETWHVFNQDNGKFEEQHWSVECATA